MYYVMHKNTWKLMTKLNGQGLTYKCEACLEKGAAIGRWISLCLQSCSPGFESQVHHQRFYSQKF